MASSRQLRRQEIPSARIEAQGGTALIHILFSSALAPSLVQGLFRFLFFLGQQ